VQQSLALGCFPRVKVHHTSSTVGGQIYIAEVNYTLMLLCIAVVAGFRSSTAIGNAYGEGYAYGGLYSKTNLTQK
jgi:KUP system potassium uptake protein